MKRVIKAILIYRLKALEKRASVWRERSVKRRGKEAVHAIQKAETVETSVSKIKAILKRINYNLAW